VHRTTGEGKGTGLYVLGQFFRRGQKMERKSFGEKGGSKNYWGVEERAHKEV